MVGIEHGTTVSTGDTATATIFNEAHSIGGLARAYQSSGAQAVVTATVTKVTLDAESYDTDSLFDSTTNYRYSPSTAGYYLVIGCVTYNDLADGDLAHAYIYKTGAAYTEVETTLGAGEDHSVQVSDIVYLGATDYIELYTYHNKGANADLKNNEQQTFLAICPLSV